jgi:hypothetical protein
MHMNLLELITTEIAELDNTGVPKNKLYRPTTKTAQRIKNLPPDTLVYNFIHDMVHCFDSSYSERLELIADFLSISKDKLKIVAPECKDMLLDAVSSCLDQIQSIPEKFYRHFFTWNSRPKALRLEIITGSTPSNTLHNFVFVDKEEEKYVLDAYKTISLLMLKHFFYPGKEECIVSAFELFLDLRLHPKTENLNIQSLSETTMKKFLQEGYSLNKIKAAAKTWYQKNDPLKNQSSVEYFTRYSLDYAKPFLYLFETDQLELLKNVFLEQYKSEFETLQKSKKQDKYTLLVALKKSIEDLLSH